MNIGGTDFGHIKMYSKKWCNHLASFHLSSDINSNSIVDLEIAVCFEDFHDIAVPSNVKT